MTILANVQKMHYYVKKQNDIGGDDDEFDQHPAWWTAR